MKKTWKNIKKLVKTVDNGQQFDRKTESNPPNSNNLNKKTLSIVASVWLFTIGFYVVLFSGVAFFTGKLTGNTGLQAETLSLYTPGIDIVNNLKGLKHFDSIQRLYVHPKEKNKMMIMIKPNYWGAINQKEKNEIILKVLEEWQKIYRNSDPDKDLQPEVYFANN